MHMQCAQCVCMCTYIAPAHPGSHPGSAMASALLCPLLLLLATIIITGSEVVFADHDGRDDGADWDSSARVRGLPGQPQSAKFAQYAGYVSVNASHGRALFYWLVESSSNAALKPLLLWLNGGPGCSSVGFGAFQEIGPFRVCKNGTCLTSNKYSWNKVANLLFVESPAGVGFSYSNVSSDYANFGDTLTAQDMHVFLLGWLRKFPQYQSRELYIVGESYGGHYVPQLAELINMHNSDSSNSNPPINLRGFMVGNPTTDDYHDMRGFVDYAWSHAIISDATYNLTQKECNFRSSSWSTKCEDVLNLIFDEYNNIDIYSLYTPSCLLPQGYNDGKRFPSFIGGSSSINRNNLHHWFHYGASYDPCMASHAEIYLNREDVQEALHANSTRLPYEWSVCSYVLSTWKDASFSVLPIYKKLISTGLRIWVYSGDTDGRIPVLSTRYSLNALRLPVKDPWRPWYHKEQVAGWLEEMEGVTLVTFRGAGHMVPSYQPSRALALIKSFLANKALPKKRH